MQEARATDANTVVIKFKVPAPRFFFFLTYKYDIGVYIVPKHIFQGQDWTTFKHFDVAKGWPVTTGPWKVAFSSPQQKVIDRRDEWWAAKAGLAPMPKVERNIWLPNATEQQNAQLLISNQIDYCGLDAAGDLPDDLPAEPEDHHALRRRSRPTATWTGGRSRSTSTTSARRSTTRTCAGRISYFIDRQQIVDVGYLGAALVSPAARCPSTRRSSRTSTGSRTSSRSTTRSSTTPRRARTLLTKKGWKKDGQGFWVDAQGNRLKLDIIGFGRAARRSAPCSWSSSSGRASTRA